MRTREPSPRVKCVHCKLAYVDLHILHAFPDGLGDEDTGQTLDTTLQELFIQLSLHDGHIVHSVVDVTFQNRGYQGKT